MLPVNGQWSEWSLTSPCSVSCGGGHETYQRNCTSPPAQFGGQQCIGDATRVEACNKHGCPLVCFAYDTDFWANDAMTISSVPNVATAELCYDECRKQAGCVYFTHVSWNKDCIIKSDRGAVTEGINGLVSGPADCSTAGTTPACKSKEP